MITPTPAAQALVDQTAAALRDMFDEVDINWTQPEVATALLGLAVALDEAPSSVTKLAIYLAALDNYRAYGNGKIS